MQTVLPNKQQMNTTTQYTSNSHMFEMMNISIEMRKPHREEQAMPCATLFFFKFRFVWNISFLHVRVKALQLISIISQEVLHEISCVFFPLLWR